MHVDDSLSFQTTFSWLMISNTWHAWQSSRMNVNVHISDQWWSNVIIYLSICFQSEYQTLWSEFPCCWRWPPWSPGHWEWAPRDWSHELLCSELGCHWSADQLSGCGQSWWQAWPAHSSHSWSSDSPDPGCWSRCRRCWAGWGCWWRWTPEPIRD